MSKTHSVLCGIQIGSIISVEKIYITSFLKEIDVFEIKCVPKIGVRFRYFPYFYDLTECCVLVPMVSD